MIKKLLSTIPLLFTITFMIAQPIIDHSQHGCHHFQNRDAIVAGMSDIPVNADIINMRSDTIDILHYDITTDATTSGQLSGVTTITFVPKMNDIGWITLDLEGLTVDSVWDVSNAMQYQQLQDTFLTQVFFPQSLNIGDTASITLAYSGDPITCPSGFGGFYFEDNYAYNLSIGLAAYPHNFGRAWFPCFDIVLIIFKNVLYLLLES